MGRIILKTLLLAIPVSAVITWLSGHRFFSFFIKEGEVTKVYLHALDKWGYTSEQAHILSQKVYAYPTVLLFTLIVVGYYVSSTNKK